MEILASERPHTWPVGGLLIDALARRDFDALHRCLDDDVRLRAMLPRGAVEVTGAANVADSFRGWFGGDDAFEIVDASLGQLGSRMYARWRVRMWPAGRRVAARTAEQHVFTSGDHRIHSLDLLCSGFQAESVS